MIIVTNKHTRSISKTDIFDLAFILLLWCLVSCNHRTSGYELKVRVAILTNNIIQKYKVEQIIRFKCIKIV